MILPPIITVSQLYKRYPSSATDALKGIDLEVGHGEIFGLLGPNAAGKTTFFSILCGLVKPTSGTVYIDGKSIENDMEAIKKKMGVVPQDIALYPTLSGRDNLLFFGRMYGLKPSELKPRVDALLDLFGFDENRNQAVNKYSGGMKRRINLLGGMLHEPNILLLDEPTVGVDVQSRRAMMEHLKDWNENKESTIIYTSHHMEQAQQFCHKVAIVDEGIIVAKGKPNELIKEHDCNSLEEVFIKLTGKKLRD